MVRNLAGIEWSAQFCADPAKVDLLRQNAKRLYDLLAPDTKQELDPDRPAGHAHPGRRRGSEVDGLDFQRRSAAAAKLPHRRAAARRCPGAQASAATTDDLPGCPGSRLGHGRLPGCPGLDLSGEPAAGRRPDAGGEPAAGRECGVGPEPGARRACITIPRRSWTSSSSSTTTSSCGSPTGRAIRPRWPRWRPRGSGNASVHVLFATPGSQLDAQKQAAESANTPLVLGPDHPLSQQAFVNQQ